MALAYAVFPAPAPIGALTVGVTDAGLALVAFGAPQRVLRALWETVPFGATVTYGELAVRGGLGRGHTAARGVGAIMGSNPLPVVVPCHRVLAADGIGGFGGGLRTKEWLLALEGVLTGALPW